MTDTPTSPDAPAPVDPWSRTPDQAAAYLAVMDAALHPPAPLNPATPSEARQRLDALISNKEWAANWTAGNRAEAAEYARLSELADQTDPVSTALNNTNPEPNLVETVGPGQFLNSRDLASAVEMFRDAGLNDDAIIQFLRGDPVGRSEYRAVKALHSARHGDEGWVARWSKGGWAEKNQQWLMIGILNSEIDESR